jgi:hypothetical protein
MLKSLFENPQLSLGLALLPLIAAIAGSARAAEATELQAALSKPQAQVTLAR